MIDDVLTIASFMALYFRHCHIPMIALADAAGCLSLYSINNDKGSFSVRRSRFFLIYAYLAIKYCDNCHCNGYIKI